MAKKLPLVIAVVQYGLMTICQLTTAALLATIAKSKHVAYLVTG